MTVTSGVRAVTGPVLGCLPGSGVGVCLSVCLCTQGREGLGGGGPVLE